MCAADSMANLIIVYVDNVVAIIGGAEMQHYPLCPAKV